jgi:hypothetical protein
MTTSWFSESTQKHDKNQYKKPFKLPEKSRILYIRKLKSPGHILSNSQCQFDKVLDFLGLLGLLASFTNNSFINGEERSTPPLVLQKSTSFTDVPHNTTEVHHDILRFPQSVS